jgi:hypothetical protein
MRQSAANSCQSDATRYRPPALKGSDAMDPAAISSLIAHRCGDEFAPSDIDFVEAALAGRDAETMSREVPERIAEVIDAMATRFAAMETRFETVEEAT